MHTRIREIRSELGMTQKVFGESLGISRDMCANIECGRVRASSTFQELLCMKYNVSAKWLQTGEGEMFLKEEPNELDFFAHKFDLSDFEKAFVKVYLRLSKEQRDAFCNGMYDELIKSSESKTEERWERDARLLQEEAEALKRDAEKCSVLPPTKKA